MRLVPVVFGLVTVGAVIGLRPVLGSIPVLVGGLLLALSPGAVYVSRYFIHEALLVAFTMTLVASALMYLPSRNPAWAPRGRGVGCADLRHQGNGRDHDRGPRDCRGAQWDLRELALGWHGRARRRCLSCVAHLEARFEAREDRPNRWRRVGSFPDRSSRSLLDGVIPGGIPMDHVGAATIVFLCVYVLFFSSFFTNFPRGLVDSLATFTIWTRLAPRRRSLRRSSTSRGWPGPTPRS